MIRRVGNLQVTTQITVYSLIITGVLIVAFLSLWLLSNRALHASDHNWCNALQLLTERPVPRPADPAANPSRETAYRLYSDFRDLERRFGC